MKQSSKEAIPQLRLLPGSQARDVQQLARLFQAMTGRMPADNEIAAARAKFEADDERRQNDERPLQ
jgi:hypothetical protein